MITSNPPGPYDPSWDSLERWQLPEWYEDAKFGIFIHWGVYAVPAFMNEWYPRHMYIPGAPEHDHHIARYGPQNEFGYKDFIPMFKAERFDPAEWAELFAEAGAKFVVPVAEHHDGFAMYETALSRWNAFEMGPKRDVIGELAGAVRAKGMVFGVSSHRAEHWWFMNGGRDIPSDVQDPALADFYGPAAPGGPEHPHRPDEAFLEDWLARCAELIDKYRPQLFWFDWWIENPSFQPYLRRFAAYYYNRAAAWGQGVAVNYKNQSFPSKAAVFDVERGQLAGIRPQFWQTDTAVAKNSWGHVEPMDYKSAGSLIHDLADIVSKNGALLLNIGPRADGSIPDEDKAILREIGAWLTINGEAIYGSRPWKVFGEGPTEVKEGSFTDTQRAEFTQEDIRFTTRAGSLYAIVLAEAKGSIALRSLASGLTLEPRTPVRATLLGSGEAPFTQTKEALFVDLPDELPCRHAVVVRIDFGAPGGGKA